MTKEELAEAMETLRRIKEASDACRAIGGTWDESKRNNEKHGNVVPKPGAK